MPDFSYQARTSAGEMTNGTISAPSEREAARMLSGQALFPLNIALADPTSIKKSRRRVKGQIMATCYSQMASLLRSGVPLLRSLVVLQEQASNATLKQVLGEVHDQVQEGVTLSDAMKRYPKVFSEIAVNMANAGAEGGFLEDALERVATFTEQQEDLKSETMGQLAYPLFLATIGSLIVGALVVFFVPKFGSMFDSLRERGELPIVTDYLLAFSEGLRTPWALFGLLAVVMGLTSVVQYFKTDQGMFLRDRLKLRVPLVGPIFQSFAVARFCRVLGTLLGNGVPILKSLDISSDAAGNRILARAIDDATENITSGASLSQPLSQSGYFPGTVVEMIAVAEESNALDSVLVEIADGLEQRTTRKLNLAVRLLEPLLLMVLAGAVLFVVVALLMPVIKMSSTIG